MSKNNKTKNNWFRNIFSNNGKTNNLKIKKPDELSLLKDNILTIKDLELGFTDSSDETKINKVIRGVSLELKKGEILSLIGESGSGKTVLSSTAFGLTGEKSVITNGTITLMNQEIQNFSQQDWDDSKYRGQIVSAVFQNPLTTLNPTMKIKNQIMEGILNFKLSENKKEAYKIAKDLLIKTRIDNPEKVLESYPHELSGGMKQRVVIASIIACKPKLIIMDEPTTALDPSVQADIIKIITDLAKEFGISIIFITHDLGVVSSISDRIAIMYSGQIMEIGTASEVIFNSQHPYTWALLSSMPDVNKGDSLETIRGSVATNLNDVLGEAFAPRNNYAMGIDFMEEAPYTKISETHKVKSWLHVKDAPEFNPPELILKRWKIFNNKYKKKK